MKLVLACLGLLVASAIAKAGPLEDRVEALERELEQLRSRVEQLEGKERVSPPRQTKSDVVVPDPAGTDAGQASVQYYLFSTRGSGSGRPPLSEGRFDVPEVLSLDPASYGIEAGTFSDYRDPSQYGTAVLRLQANLTVSRAGRYELSMHARPAREGGSPVTATMDVRLRIDGRDWFAVSGLESRRPVRSGRELAAGVHVLDLEVVSMSPGYGASAVDSTVLFELREPGAAAPKPLNRFLSAP